VGKSVDKKYFIPVDIVNKYQKPRYCTGKKAMGERDKPVSET